LPLGDVVGPRAPSCALVQRDAHAVALDRLRLHAQQPVLDQPVLVRRAQQAVAQPVAALAVVHVRDEAVHRDRLGLLRGRRPVLLDRHEAAVGRDVDTLDRLRRARRQLAQVRGGAALVDPVDLLEVHVAEHEHQQRLPQVLLPREAVLQPRRRRRLLPHDRQPEVVGDELHHPRARAGRVDPPRGTPHRQRHRPQHRGDLRVLAAHLVEDEDDCGQISSGVVSFSYSHQL
jgi:hypothetical protein